VIEPRFSSQKVHCNVNLKLKTKTWMPKGCEKLPIRQIGTFCFRFSIESMDKAEMQFVTFELFLNSRKR
jgi:hypothetical protein